jgi:hypothetical protein
LNKISLIAGALKSLLKFRVRGRGPQNSVDSSRIAQRDLILVSFPDKHYRTCWYGPYRSLTYVVSCLTPSIDAISVLIHIPRAVLLVSAWRPDKLAWIMMAFKKVCATMSNGPTPCSQSLSSSLFSGFLQPIIIIKTLRSACVQRMRMLT